MASHRCDLPGCTRIRARWQRLCSPCFEALPRELRNRIITARRLGHMSDWRGACKRAAQHLARTRPITRVTAQQAFENQQRLLGEQD